MKISKKQLESGESLIEPVIAIGIFGAVLIPFILSVSNLIFFQAGYASRIQASHYAREELEITYNIAINTDNWESFVNKYHSGIFHPETTGNLKLIPGEETIEGGFTRQITISKAWRDNDTGEIVAEGTNSWEDANTLEVVSKISWRERGIPRNIELTTYLINLEFLAGSTPTPTPSPSPTPITIEVRVNSGYDDAEEKASGSMNRTSSDLELVYDGGDQTVGMRFNGVDIPQGAAITDAYVQFQVDEINSGITSLIIQGENIDNASAFTSSNGNISSRAKTTAAVSWFPVPWTTTGAAGPDQRTPNIASVIQEVVNRPDWYSGNSLVIIITGTGERTAEAYDGDSNGAPLLYVEY